MATGLLLLRLVLALSKLLLREFFELLDATYTKISTLSSSFFNERAGETIASPSRRARRKGCARCPPTLSPALCVCISSFDGYNVQMQAALRGWRARVLSLMVHLALEDGYQKLERVGGGRALFASRVATATRWSRPLVR